MSLLYVYVKNLHKSEKHSEIDQSSENLHKCQKHSEIDPSSENLHKCQKHSEIDPSSKNLHKCQKHLEIDQKTFANTHNILNMHMILESDSSLNSSVPIPTGQDLLYEIVEHYIRLKILYVGIL